MSSTTPTAEQMLQILNELRAQNAQLHNQNSQLVQRVSDLETSRFASPSPGVRADSSTGHHFDRSIPKPDVFKGGHHNRNHRAESWLAELARYLEATGRTFNVVWATTFFRDDATKWWATVERENPGVRTCDWAHFKKLVLDQYGVLLAEHSSRSSLYEGRQTGSVDSFIRFWTEHLQNVSDMAEKDKVLLFQKGLKKDIRMEVVKANPATLKEAQEKAKLVESLTNLHLGGRDRAGSRHIFTTSRGRVVTRGSGFGNGGDSGAAPMEINRTEMKGDPASYSGSDAEGSEFEDGELSDRSGGSGSDLEDGELNNAGLSVAWDLSKDEMSRLRKERKCFVCKQPGHWGRDCPRAKKGGLKKPGHTSKK